MRPEISSAGDAGATVGPDAGVFGSRGTNRQARFPRYWSMLAPEKRDSRAFSAGFVCADPAEIPEAAVLGLDQSPRRLAAPPEPELKKGWPFEKDQPCEVSDKPSCSLPSLNRFSCHWRRRSPWPCSRGLRHRRPYRRSFRRQRPCLGRGGNALRQSGSRLR